jgi:hypothetical protein
MLYRRRVRCSIAETLGAALAGMGLSHAIGLGVFAGLAQGRAVFEVTGKGHHTKAPRTASNAFGGAREEALLLIGLLLCAVSVALTRQVNHLESLLWIAVLTLQALPYLASVAWAAISRQPEQPLPAPEALRLPADARGLPASSGGDAWRGAVLQRSALPPSGAPR